MDDLISRQAVIEALEKAIMGGLNWDYILAHLPSAQSEQLGMNLAEVGTECISRQAAIDAIDKCSVWVMYTQGDSQKDESEFAENIIKQTKRAIQSMLREDLPSAQSMRKRGKWITSKDGYWKTCSNCDADVDVSLGLGIYVDNDEVSEMNFCPNCGCQMTEGGAT